MDTEPVPAPTSQQTAFGVSCNLERHTLRTSLLVMGTSFPGSKLRKNASSGRPGVTISFGVSFSISAALSLSNVWERSSCALPRVIASSG